MNIKKLINSPLVNDVLTGLLVAASFAAIIPHEALADLATTATNTGTNVVNPAIKVVDFVSYGIGTVFTVAGIANAKKHADNPGSNPLGPALGKFAAGAGFLVAPAAIGMLSSTGSNTLNGTATFQQIPGVSG